MILSPLNGGRATLNKELLVATDSTGHLTFQQVRDDSTLTFVPGDQIGKPGPMVYWAKVTIQNGFNQNVDFRISAAFWDYIDLYLLHPNDSLSIIRTGILRTATERGGSDFPTFTLPAGKPVRLFARLGTSGHFRRTENVSIVIVPHESSLETERFRLYMSGILVGILLGFAFYNLSFASSGLDGSYVWYFMYLISLALSFSGQYSSNTSFLTQFFLPEYPMLGLYLKRFSDPIGFGSLIIFAMYFFSTRSKYPFWHKVLLAAILMEVLFYSYWFIGLGGTSLVSLLIHLAAVGTVLGVALAAYHDGYRVARFFVAGQMLVFLGVLLSIFTIIFHIDLLWFLPDTRFIVFAKNSNPFFLSAIESLIFSIALTERQQSKLEKQVAERTSDLNDSLLQLKATQNQLIQSEKMAALGELTAGIAHEIQNPLNFVNNFSELNAELINELRAAAESGNVEQVRALAKGIKENEEKINHHGKRAGSIVKGMLQHSRNSTGKKEPTDINALCDEYLRLAYHGLRAKDKSFNAKFETQLDPTMPKINVVPQDIGRVVLNLINNAFYACTERSRSAVSEKQRANSQGPNANYEPTVIVSTKYLGTSVEICVTDNGNGIPTSIKDKIFQPFFTTKPTGQGTGLGLSLSYDIVTKGHGGELKVITKEGEGSTFAVTLPS